jgi:biotin-dependent carboxylase-like uncharacterized protein
MGARLLVRDPGPQTTLQDLGRSRGRRFGIPLGGAADATAHRLALAMLGLPPDAASLECRLMGPTLVAEDGPVRVLLAGDAPATVRLADGGALPLPPWRSVTLKPGDSVSVGLLARSATAYLACDPPPAVPLVQGARGTMLRASFGGFEGRPLVAGDRLPLEPGAPAPGERQARPVETRDGPIRVVMGPQTEHFTERGIACFLEGPFTVTGNADRMGVRLSGPVVEHGPLGPDLMSEGLAPGAIQVPGDGQPIVLGVDAQTIGGYPKIATVIAADIPRLGRLRPGDTIVFAAVDLPTARAAFEEGERALARAIEGVRPAPPLGGLDVDALHRVNLLSGKVDARAPHHFPDALDE